MPTNLCTQLSKKQDVFGDPERERFQSSLETLPQPHTQRLGAAHEQDSSAELLLPACRDTGRSLALSGTAFTISP